MTATTFPALLQRFFTDRLVTQMEASRHTIAGYRDTFRIRVRVLRTPAVWVSIRTPLGRHPIGPDCP
jgi:hypothetical protein